MTLVETPAPDAAGREDALERLLGEIAVRIRSQHRILPSVDEAIALEPDGLSLVYVLAGDVRMPGGVGLPDVIGAGDALLASGRRPITLRVPAGAGVLISRLALADSAAHLNSLLPDTAWIRRFDDLEPAAAALAHHMGIGVSGRCPEREGDLVICRMMATTLLQSVIRAWTTLDCAPEGWPSRSGDVFLDRVIAAVSDEPGRGWTVERMASVAALSRSVFAERFQSAIGRSPASYVTEVRMKAAKGMLDAGRSVSEVSRSLGYGSDEGFSRAFRRSTGMTPSVWRSTERAPAAL